MSKILLFTIFLGTTGAWAGVAQLSEAREVFNQGRTQEAIKMLDSMKLEDLSKSQVALRDFAMGAWYQKLEDWEKSRLHLDRARKADEKFVPYAYFLLGHGYKMEKNYSEAQESFSRILHHHPPRNILFETRFELSEMLMERGLWNSAYQHLAYLERKWKNQPRHPEVLWRLVKVDQRRKLKWRACRWARMLYSAYPAHPLTLDWGIDLQKAKYEGEELGCMASFSDQKKRIRRWQWAGQAQRAREEIEVLRQRAVGPAKLQMDQLFADFLSSEGFVEEALNILLPYFEKHQRNVNYLMLLAKISSQAGEFRSAAAIYHNVFKLSSRSKMGRTALFRAAFLSYQFQDYDGAARRFEEVIRKFPNSGLSRDAQWHLAWISYLKGNYELAAKSFSIVKKQVQKHRRRWSQLSEEKLDYWLAMSYLKQEKYDQAGPLFKQIFKGNGLSFYSFAAIQRFNSIPGQSPVRQIADVGLPTEKDLKTPESEAPPSEEATEDEQSESEETVLDVNAETEPDANTPLEAQAPADEAPVEAEVVTDAEFAKWDAKDESFQDSRLQKRIELARELILMGFDDWAKWELYEIERRTTNEYYLKMLMTAYEGIGFYHRSAQIADQNFFRQRLKQGVDGAKYLWDFAFPMAFRPTVERYSSQFGVDRDLVWAVMRAESNYRTEVQSPVGARGLMQVMPNTAYQVAKILGENSFHDRQLWDPDVNIRVGARYLARLRQKFEDLVPLVSAAYNAGPHRVDSWLSGFGRLDMDEWVEHIPFIETRNYVKKVVRNFCVYKTLYGKKMADTSWIAKPIPLKPPRVVSPKEMWN